MSGRKTIGRNPLSVPSAEVARPGPNPLDVLIPKSEADLSSGAEVAVITQPERPPVIVPARVAEVSSPRASGAESVRMAAGDASVTGAAGITEPAAVRAVGAAEPIAASPAARKAEAIASTEGARTQPKAHVEPPSPVSPGPAPGQYLVFETGGESVAISILHVREIVEYGLVTRVPRMPEAIRGVTNLRGSIVPVVDLAVRLGLPSQPLNPHTCVVVVEACLGGQPSVVGLVADAVSTVRDLARDDVSPTPALGAKVTVDAFAGLGRMGDRIFPVLDTNRMLSGLDLGPQQSACR